MKRVCLSTAYLLVACVAMIFCDMKGQHQNDSVAAEVRREEYFPVGKDANLSCDNRTWSDVLHYIWNINISGVHCLISESKSIKNPPHNNCTGGKKLRNTTRGASSLHIPQFGLKDEGTYKCEAVYKGGADPVVITVMAEVQPHLFMREERLKGQRFAVCTAAWGRPAATVSWEGTKASPNVTKTRHPNGTFTVESWLPLPLNTTKESLTCVSTSRFGTHNISETVEHLHAAKAPDKIFPLVIGCAILVIVVSAVGFSYAARKHLSSLIGPCSNSEVPSSTESKPPQEAEEVEPYESYVQRVNSIYNSSADLFGV